jgi:two-component system, OmpR family, alkaline phosphatase synthesis response regulator PhoP
MGLILVVEDERAVAETLKAILEDEGYQVIVATNGRDALAILIEERPQLVVSDLMMPLMNGKALYQAMQADEQLRSIPFLVVSSLDADLVRKQIPGVMTLPKPFRINQILAAVSKLIADHQDGAR